MPRKLLNVMYSAGEDFVSIHKVHGRVAKVLKADFDEARHWFLRGDSSQLLGYPLEELSYWQANSKQIKGRGLAFLKKLFFRRRIAKAMTAFQPDALLIDSLRVARLILPLLVQWPQPARIVLVFHSPVRLAPADVKLFRSFTSRRLMLAAVSNGVAEQLQLEYPELEGYLIGIPNANDPEDWPVASGSRDEQRAALGFGRDDILFGAVGRLHKHKNFVFLVHSFARVASRNAQAHLLIVGEGEQRAEMEALIEHYGLQQQIHLLGFQSDVASLYRAFDWLVCPSVHEGLGLVIGESLQAGTPVLTSDLAVFREQTRDAGLYAPVNDLEAWEQLLGDVLVCSAAQRSEIYTAQLSAYDPQERWRAFAEGYRRCFCLEDHALG